ncbi:MAG: MFS transporter [Clostridia bacterium]|nr:MFS transporter [Clostridia bacterium]
MKSYRRLKFACYSGNTSMSVVGNLSPLLFLTFRELYGISYSLLGLLVLINFCTQLGIDLIFSFFSHKFNIQKTVRLMPILTVIGLFIFALWPYFFPQTAYVGLVAGTVLFSVSSGLGEVLISPIIAAIPAEDPDREMSKLHSVYAWGVVGVVLFSTLFLLLFGKESWHWLALLLALIPITSAILYATSEIPTMETPEKTSGALHLLKNKGLWLCVIAIFLGGSAECTMAQWCSGYLEQALGIPKVWGDIFGVALFAVMLGTGRTLYAKIGKNITKVLLACTIGSTLCYLTAAISPLPMIGLLACALTGLCTSMLWPGNLIVASDRFPTGGVFVFALMAAGGDFGASVGPQLVGVVTDAAIENPALLGLAESLSLSPEQLGMKLGMLVGMLFPLLAIPVMLMIRRKKG